MMQQQMPNSQPGMYAPDAFATGQGGYNLGFQSYMFTTTVTTTTTTVVHNFGFSSTYVPPQVDTSYLADNKVDMRGYGDDGNYDGPFDANGQRSGLGTCEWADGSKYEGDWLNNVRHGNGKFTDDDYEYAGQWHSDMKHGRGRLKDGEEPEIYGAWSNDKLNGLANVEGTTVLYKEGMAVTLTGKEFTCGQFCRMLCQVISCGLIYLCVSLIIAES